MITAVCPGSFDPVTLGHVDIITRAASIFDKVYVAVLVNPKKSPLFDEQERVELLKRSTAHLDNVEIESFNGLLADFVEMKKSRIIVKGLRAVSDFEYEFQMALANRKLSPNIETVFLTTSADNMFLSSSVVKQIAGFGGDISGFVPPEVCERIYERLGPKD
ncbi:MAG: pantetheine-phosphate adenylyltransferase [Clostridia bacterium]|nr:pantetheine-phosphate adenylyltransferase [Oscillospiraceae bacterium]MBQ6796863.1 pantetheine-phosphate adenylyltransferase [Clostridia bacterium]